MITYNHRAYIEKAIARILAQEADFNFELVIGDDCSLRLMEHAKSFWKASDSTQIASASSSQKRMSACTKTFVVSNRPAVVNTSPTAKGTTSGTISRNWQNKSRFLKAGLAT